MHTLTDNTRSTEPIYWLHTDHLGSTSWVTDTAGIGVQHFGYLPFGEPLYSKKTGTFSSRYTFSGKERDTESGMNYFGARYYNSDLSIWISVDPMVDKYPKLSPYTYCADNPVRFFDDDGREIWGPDDPNKKNILQKAWTSFKKFDQSLFGGYDGGTTGKITKQDVEVGTAVIATIVTAGAAAEAETIIGITMGTVATINNIDDATINAEGKTLVQRTTSDNPAANEFVNYAKLTIAASSSGYSGYKATSAIKSTIKNGGIGIDKIITTMVDTGLSGYSAIKSIFTRKKDENHK